MTSSVTYLDDWDHLRQLPRRAHVASTLARTTPAKPSRLFVQPRHAYASDNLAPTLGWRGYLASLGVQVQPSPNELAERRDAHAAAKQWRSSQAIAVVGSCSEHIAGITARCLATVFSRQGGGTISVQDFAKVPAHSPEELQAWTEHESMLSRLRIIKVRNDVDDPRLPELLARTQQLVVASTTQAIHVEAAAATLRKLADGSARERLLAKEAVVILVVTDPRVTDAEIAYAQARLSAESGQVETVGFDRAIVADDVAFDALSSMTQRRWLGVAARVAEAR